MWSARNAKGMFLYLSFEFYLSDSDLKYWCQRECQTKTLFDLYWQRVDSYEIKGLSSHFFAVRLSYSAVTFRCIRGIKSPMFGL